MRASAIVRALSECSFLSVLRAFMCTRYNVRGCKQVWRAYVGLCTYMCVCACMRALALVCVSLCPSACVYVHAFVHVCERLRTCACAYERMFARLRVFARVCVRMRVCVRQVSMRMHVRVYVASRYCGNIRFLQYRPNIRFEYCSNIRNHN